MGVAKRKGKLITGLNLMHNPDLLNEKWFAKMVDFLNFFLWRRNAVLMVVKCKGEKAEAIVPYWAKKYDEVVCIDLKDWWGGITLWKKAKKWASEFSREHKGLCYTTVEEVVKAGIYLAWRKLEDVADNVEKVDVGEFT